MKNEIQNINLLNQLLNEKNARLKGGLYHQTQIKLSYNTNRIEGSKLSEAQTRYIYETNTLVVENGDTTANVDDILETMNHFACLNYLLDIAAEKLSEEIIKKFHYLLKINTSQTKKTGFNAGEYKTMPNVVGGIETTPPKKVNIEMKKLLESYNLKITKSIEDIIEFHFHFERIHPFQDGNGRVGRLILFKECLANNIVPFIIEDEYKFFYYRGLTEYLSKKEYLIETCFAAKDEYKRMIDYFYPENLIVMKNSLILKNALLTVLFYFFY
jgi:Fic family protein